VALGLACAPETPRDAQALAEAQATLAVDSSQARLWTEAARSGAAAGLADARADSSVVQRRPEGVPDRPPRAAERPFPDRVEAALAIRSAPELEQPFSGRASVRSSRGEFLILDLGGDRTLRLQVKVGGRPLRASEGESVDVFYRQGDVLEGGNVLALRLARDDLVFAIQSDTMPVSLTLPGPRIRIRARQVGTPEGNTMDVALTVGAETRTLRPGQQAGFARAGLTMKLLASIAVQGEAAPALEGPPYGIELLGWRTSPPP
jgi:hypothetical protein